MEVLRDGVLAFLSAVGLTTCVWLAAGAFLSREKRRNSGVLLVLPLTGDAPAMTQDVRELLRLRRDLSLRRLRRQLPRQKEPIRPPTPRRRVAMTEIMDSQAVKAAAAASAANAAQPSAHQPLRTAVVKAAELARAAEERARDKQHAKGKKTARERLDLLFDTGTFEEIASRAAISPAATPVRPSSPASARSTAAKWPSTPRTSPSRAAPSAPPKARRSAD